MRLTRHRLCILCAALAALTAWLVLAVPFARAEGGQVSFINEVAPILKENCFACHDAKKRSGKFDMTSFEKLMTGGAGGEGITAGKHDDSELYALIVSQKERRMPPRKDNLSPVPPTQTEVVKKWIDQGAKLDTGLDPKADLVKELRVRWKPPAPMAAYKYPVIVNALTFTPDGKQLVVGGHHELTVWEIASAKLVKRIYTRAERAYAMAYLPDGKLAVAGGRPGQEGDVRIFDLGAPGKADKDVQILDGVNDPKVMVKQLLDADDSVLCLAVSPDSKRIASGGCDRTVRVWEYPSGKLEQSIENHADWVLGVTFAPDGKHLLTCSRDKTAKVWDLAAKESVLTFPEHQAPVFGIAVKADSKAGFSGGADKQLRTWNAAGEGKQIKVLGTHADDILKLVQHPKEPVMVTTSADKTVKVWNPETGANTKTLTGLTDHVFAAAISTDGKQVAAGAYDGEVRVWNIADGAAVKAFNASPGYVAAAPPPEPKKK
ncbi:MAG TPA: c-type cytochrome domain-containing protein [Gemmataceae bacterium]|nr:c-type cytochrome domain-containing protein [Gemmataceae bacterium]